MNSFKDADSLISSISGSDNYLESLQKITGDIMDINFEEYDRRSLENEEFDAEIRSSLMVAKNTVGEKESEELNDIVKKYFTESIQFGFEKNKYEFIERKSKKSKVPKKPKKQITNSHRPENFVKSEFWKIIKQVEKKANNVIEALNISIDDPKYDTAREVYLTNIGLEEVKNFYGKKIMNDDDTKMIATIKRSCAGIINNYMVPMYDIHKTIQNNWGKIDVMFKSHAFDDVTNSLTQQNIEDILYLFIVAKYRCTITGNNKYYVKLFMDIVNKKDGDKHSEEETNIASMDGARFLELLDTIDFDKLDKKQKVYTFANKSKDIITKLVNRKQGEGTTEDILKEITELLSTQDNGESTASPEDVIESPDVTTENCDIFE